MRWTERQRAMLGAMGVRLFGAPEAGEPPTPEVAVNAPPKAAVHAPPAAAIGAAKATAASAPAAAVRRGLPVDCAPQPAPQSPPGTAQRADIAAMGWSELRDAVVGCRACALCESRQQAVFGVGHPRAHWMVIGEAPGEQEDQRGEPFVGPAGQLLDNMLRALGLSRDEGPPERQVFIANTLKCRPPKNRNPDPAETAQCAPFLERQIALVQPRIILAMGRFAAQAQLASELPLGKLRGAVHDWRGVPVVVTYHPAYLLRAPTEKARAWEDLCLAANVAQGA